MGLPPDAPWLRYVAQDARTGYGEAADRLVRALREAGTPVDYHAWFVRDRTDPGQLRPHSRDPFPRSTAAPNGPTIAHLIPEHYARLRGVVRELDGEPRPFLAHTVWETHRLPQHWPALLNGVDRVLVPTEWNRNLFRSSGVTAPVSVVPHVVCDPVPGDGGVPLGYPPATIVFYVVSRWDQRKNPAGTIEAFADAFTADDPVALVVKTGPMTQYPVPSEWGSRSGLAGSTLLEVARILRSYSRPPEVRVEVGEWTPARMAGLHTRGDCYVSMSHGEGWDLPAFDACAYGNPVIAPAWGGPLEYLDASASFLIEQHADPVEHFDRASYAPDQRWAAPRKDHTVELLRTVAADLAAARRRAAPLRRHVLAQYAPGRVVGTLRHEVPELEAALRPSAPRSRRRQSVPRLAHFLFGLRPEPEPFHLVHYLAIRSCLDTIRPDEVRLHCHHPPAGPYWDLLRPEVSLQAVDPVPLVANFDYSDPLVGRYAYAHHADFVRLNVLATAGGLYADLDTLFLAPLPTGLWDEPFTIGREADVPDAGTGRARPALSNALLLAVPGASFVERWRTEMEPAFDGSWCAHSCFLAWNLAAKYPDSVHLEPQRSFHAFEPSREGVRLLLEDRVADLEGMVSLHLAAHLWWEEERCDFTSVCWKTIDEAWVGASGSTYATAARQFLPEPALAR